MEAKEDEAQAHRGRDGGFVRCGGRERRTFGDSNHLAIFVEVTEELVSLFFKDHCT